MLSHVTRILHSPIANDCPTWHSTYSFFFSSRRRHTRCSRDWSSDVCSSDLTKIMMNVGNPQLAFDFAQLPNEGVGLARLEFIINNNIGVHPKAILDYPAVDARSEERRVGKECRSRWSPYH